MIGAYVFQAFGGLDIDVQSLLGTANISAYMMAQPETISSLSYIKFWSALDAATNRHKVALAVGRAAGRSASNIMHMVSFDSATVGLYLANLMHCSPLIGAPLSRLAYTQGRLEIIHQRDDADAATNLHMWVQIVAVVETIRGATGQRIETKRVSLRTTSDTGTKLADVDGLANLASYFGVQVETGADCFVEFADNAIDSSFLVQPMLLSQSIGDSLDGQLWQMLRSQPARILVTRALEMLLPSGHATIEAVAAHLAIGQRILQRRLQDENTCFRSVLFATPQRLAQKYKRIGGLRQAEIAKRLGFQDVNSYYRVARY
jgi:AraC-like DNA-binding protein